MTVLAMGLRDSGVLSDKGQPLRISHNTSPREREWALEQADLDPNSRSAIH